MNDHHCAIGLLLCLALSACSSMNTGSECLMDENAVTEFVTYSWLPRDSITTLDNTDEITPTIIDNIQAEVEHGFKHAGYMLIEDAESADFIIAATLVTQRQMEDTVFFPPGDSDFMSEIKPEDLHLKPRVTAVLTIDAYDGATGLPFWRGWAHRPLNLSAKNTPRRLIRQAVTTIIAQFPHRIEALSTEVQAAVADTAESAGRVLLDCDRPLRG